MQTQALHGVRVLDLGQIYNGPYCTLLLAAHGAEVIKVEPPHGELLRRMDRSPGGASYPFLMLNANKKSIVINLKLAAGRDLLLRLVEHADVLVENFAAGVMERLGIGYEVVSARNPALIFASGSGFGEASPYAGFAAMDFTIQALVGAMSITGDPDGAPLKCGPTFIDMLGATHLFAGILLALQQRAQTGRGQRVEVAMFDAAVPTLLSYLAPFYELNREITRSGNRHVVGGATPYNTFRCSDGYVAILCVSDQHWFDLCTVMQRDDLRAETRWHQAPERARDWQSIESEVERWTSGRARNDVARLLGAAGIPSAPVRTIAEVGSDPHLFARGMVRQVSHPARGAINVFGSAIKLDDHSEPSPSSPPAIGEHTEAVLHELLGLDTDAIIALRRTGAI